MDFSKLDDYIKTLDDEVKLPIRIRELKLGIENYELRKRFRELKDKQKNIEKMLKELDEKREEFKKELDYDCCGVCYSRHHLELGCCNNGLCMDCWREVENAQRSKCPFCRRKLKPLVDILIEKMKKIQL